MIQQIMTGPQLVDYYNILVETFNKHEDTTEILPHIKKFRNPATAKKRIASFEARLTLLKKKEKPRTKPQAGGSVKGRKKKGQRIEFAASKVQSEPRAGTIQYEALQLARKGCKIEQVVSLIEEQYAKTGKEMKCTACYRGYQVLRLLTNRNGYGFRQDGDVIHVIENAK